MSGENQDKQIFAFPDLVYKELLAALVAFIVLVIWSMAVDAPLKEIADPNWTENPAKAPWYFVGLQEVLVYFDPWIAGVMIPGLIIFGLMILPYMDPNPEGVGEYAPGKRKVVTTVFLFGYLFWFGLILVGQFLRGPSWQFYWPWEDWAIHKAADEKLVNISGPTGILMIAGYFGGGLALAFLAARNLHRRMGTIRFLVVWTLALVMFGIVGKILLRVFFDIKYIYHSGMISI